LFSIYFSHQNQKVTFFLRDLPNLKRSHQFTFILEIRSLSDLLLPFVDEFNTLVCRASRGTQANLGLMVYRILYENRNKAIS
jgi:hypothetical protein